MINKEKSINNDNIRKGAFISFEGIDGSGKTTQINLLNEYLEKHNIESIISKEFTARQFSNLNSAIQNLHNDTQDLLPLAKKFNDIGIINLIASVRYQHINVVISPSIEQGKIVICDRFIDSTAVYQSEIVSMEEIFQIHKDMLMPDITFMIDISIEGANHNLHNRINNENDPFDNKSYSYKQKLVANYGKLARKYQDRIVSINGNRDPWTIHAEIVNILEIKNIISKVN